MGSWPRRAAAALTAVLIVLPASPPAPASAAVAISTASAVELTLVPGRNLVAVALGDAGVVIGRTDGTVVGPVRYLRNVWSVHGAADGYVYAAQPEQHRLLRIDPSTRTVVRRWSLPTRFCPRSIAKTGRFLVFGYSCYEFPGADPVAVGVAALDTRSGSLSTRALGLLTPMVDAAPGFPGRVVVTDAGMHPTSLLIFDVTGSRPRLVASRYFEDAKFWDLQISPDGTKVALADMYGHAVRVYRTSDAKRVIQRTVPVSPRAVSWRGNGSVVVGGYDIDDQNVGAVVNVATGAVAPVISWSTGRERFVGERCLVVAPGNTRALVATTALWERDSQLESYGLRTSQTTLTPPSAATVGAPAHFTAQVVLESGVAPPPGSTVTVTRHFEYSEDYTTVGTFPVDADGRVEFTDVPQKAVTTVWTAEYAGDFTHVASRASVTMLVSKAPASLTVAFQTNEVRGKQVSGDLLVALSPVIEGRWVTIETSAASGQTRSQYQLDDQGHLTVPMTVDEPTEVDVSFVGGPNQEDAQASIIVGP